MVTDARLAAYRKLEGRMSGSAAVASSTSPADAIKSPRTSIERKRAFRRSSTRTLERSVWEDSPRSSIASSPVARPRCQPDALISRLPPEILAAIFEWLAATQHPRSPGGPLDHVGSIGWLVVSHVCRHWRDLALSMSALWATSVGTLAAPGAAETMLERAQGTPLTLTLDDAHTSCAFHATNLHLAKALYVGVSSTAYSANVLYDLRTALAAQPLPALETVTIAHAFGEIPPHNFDLPPVDAPSLRRISFENYFVPWRSGALTDLTLARSGAQKGGARPSFDELLRLLRNTPTLQRINLKNWISDDAGSAALPERRVALPFLSHIAITDRPAQAVMLWSALAVPASSYVQLSISLLGAPPDAAVAAPNLVFRALALHFRVPHAAPFAALSLADSRGDSFLRVRASVSAGAGEPKPRLAIDLFPWHSPAGLTGFQHALAALALHIELGSVHTLALDCAADDCSALSPTLDAAALGWREPLAPLSALRTLELHDRPPASLLRALGPDARAGTLLLPGLRVLALPPCAHRRRDEARALAWMALANALRARAAAGRALRRLEMFGYFRLDPPTRTRTFQDELDKVVVEVEWEL